MRKETIIAIAIIGGLVAIGLYALFTIQSPVRLPPMVPKGNYTLTLVTTFSEWHMDDFKVWLFYASGEEGGVIVRPPVASRIGIIKLEFLRENDITKWIDIIKRGDIEISGFSGLTMSLANATMICRLGIVKPIEDPEVLELARNIRPPFVAYTPDGKLCWVATDFVPVFTWVVNNKTAEKYGVPVPRSWEDLIKPEYASLLLNGVYVAALYRLDATPSLHSLHSILYKHGWDEGWVYLTYLAGASILRPGPYDARNEVVMRPRALLAILTFSDALGARGFAPKYVELVFPKNATPIRVSPIGITVSADEHDTYGMYALIKSLLTEAQSTLYMYRTGWASQIGTLPPQNHTNQLLLTLREQVIKEMYTEYNETWTARLSNITLVYINLLFNDTDVNNLLKDAVKALAQKYRNKEIDINTYYSYLSKIGEPIEFVNPLTGTVTRFTENIAWQLVEASSKGVIDSQTLYNAFKEALINRLQQIIQELKT